MLNEKHLPLVYLSATNMCQAENGAMAGQIVTESVINLGMLTVYNYTRPLTDQMKRDINEDVMLAVLP